jgi:hypothetical protein
MAKSAEPVAGQTNTDTAPRKVGRPLKFQSLIELQTKIDAYFFDCDPHPIEVTRYKWHEIEETYKTFEKGKEVEKTRMVTDHTRKPETYTEFTLSDRESYSITGLALALDTNRRTLLNYEDGQYLKSIDDDDYDAEENALMLEFIHTIKRAKSKIEHDVQRRLESNAVVGTIFNLKNNFEWIDRQETDGTQEVIVTTRKHNNGAK